MSARLSSALSLPTASPSTEMASSKLKKSGTSDQSDRPEKPAPKSEAQSETFGKGIIGFYEARNLVHLTNLTNQKSLHPKSEVPSETSMHQSSSTFGKGIGFYEAGYSEDSCDNTMGDDYVPPVFVENVAGLASGMNYLGIQGISLATIGVENFDIFVDTNDRFSIAINPNMDANGATESEADDGEGRGSWGIFNALCQKVLNSANRALHNEEIEREPVALDSLQMPPSPVLECPRVSVPPGEPLQNQEKLMPPRREIYP
ncbi:hypothetical protein B0H14DRAFT_2571798 [Mycena olivaceomarginata]|nr:hypothetical protein B0H14DRAFT_2571798 [Mycena olivaceomarginata]